MPPLPPTYGTVYTLSPYSDCQLQEVFARELRREQSGAITDEAAWREAADVVKALAQGGQGLALGAEPGEVSWPDLICSANAYARRDDEGRAALRAAYAEGRPIWSVATSITEPIGCDLRAIDDPAYQPAPICQQRKDVAQAALIGAACGAALLGLVLASAALAEHL